MPSHAERQRQFAEALRDATRPIPPGVRVPEGAAPAERFAVYRNNVAVGLIAALRDSFPVVEQLVGAEFFAAMAKVHALQSPPSSPVLLEYGADFPDFIERFAPAASLSYLAEVARLEWHWLESFHAADALPLRIQDLASVPRDHWPALGLTLHPSVRIRRFEHPAVSIWRLHKESPKLELRDGGEAVLLVRPYLTVEALELSPGGFAFLQAVRSGQIIEAAACAALEAEPDLDIAQVLRVLFRAGAFAGFVDTLGAPS